jgi:hypothetical protein
MHKTMGFCDATGAIAKRPTMTVISAVCSCKHMDENNRVLALRDGPLQFVNRWGLLAWIGFVLLTLISGGLWLVIVLFYHRSDLVTPKYRCQFCHAEVPVENLRGVPG